MADAINHKPDSRVPLRDYVEAALRAHRDLHEEHEKGHVREHAYAQAALETAAELGRATKADSNEWRGSMKDREATFATKTEFGALADAIGKLEDADIRRTEREALRLISEAEQKQSAERRLSASQWRTGLIVGGAASAIAIIVNLAMRLAEIP